MAVNLRGRHLRDLCEFTTEEIHQFIEHGIDLKAKRLRNEPFEPLKGKSLAMIFQKASTRTRVSFEVGMGELGGRALYLSGNDLQIGRGESIADTARVLSRYVHGIMARVFGHDAIVQLAAHSRVPVINGLSDRSHPCQILADLMTIHEKKRRLEGLKLAYIGDGNNVCVSLLEGCSRVGMSIAVASPKGFEPPKDSVKDAVAEAKRRGAKVEITNDPKIAVKDADAIYTDVWASMGQEKEHAERLKRFQGFQVNEKLTARANPDHLVLHCLPAHRGEEITDEVCDGPNSVLFDEAENRLHVQKAILALLL